TGLDDYYVYSLAIQSDTIFAGTGVGLYMSSDYGASWVLSSLTDVTVDGLLVNNDTIFAGTGTQGVYVSTDKGADWTQRNVGLTNMNVRTFLVKDGNVFAGTEGGGAYVSTNNGVNWIPINNGLTNMSVWSFIKVGNAIFSGTANGMFYTTNNGASWLSAGLNGNWLPSVVVSGENLIAGGYADVWWRPLSDLISGVEQQKSNDPIAYTLQQNYPDPFSAETKIDYSLPQAGRVVLKVYNPMGEEVATLVNGMNDAGKHEVDFSGENLPSGVYIYRLRAGSFSQEGKMTLLR
ncbi:MAG TPA: T9SS type A sorting domain-containing protein, partial [Candidatus Kapabacteria bacterium]|nr:T9SS type A sorting domain-containing protein [Candidatus Kapabacteria bacterium]